MVQPDLRKLKQIQQKETIHQENKDSTRNKHKTLQTHFVASYHFQPVNGKKHYSYSSRGPNGTKIKIKKKSISSFGHLVCMVCGHQS